MGVLVAAGWALRDDWYPVLMEMDTTSRRGLTTPGGLHRIPHMGIRDGSGDPPGALSGDERLGRPRGALHRHTKAKNRLLARLKRIEGQVRGLQRMVEEERYCPEVLTQVAAVQASLRAAAEVLLQDHLRHCVTTALRSGDPAGAEAMYAELTDLFKKYSR